MFEDVTPRLGLPYVVAAQAQKHIPINESLARLDGLVQLAVESRAEGQKVAPDQPFLQRLAQQVGWMQRRHGANGPLAGVKAVPLAA